MPKKLRCQVLTLILVLFTSASCSRPDVALRFRSDGEPAVPEPAPTDRNWAAADYLPLAPSRQDGKPTFTSRWFLWEVVWSQVLAGLTDKPDLRYLEVGVYEGQSLIWIFDNVLLHPTSSGVAIDLFDHEGLEGRFLENIDRAGIGDRITTLVGYSNVALRTLENQEFDIIYIDASHTAANVLRDAILSWDLLKEGGFLIFDDYGLAPEFPTELRPEVSIDAFITAFRDELRVVHRGYQVIVQRFADPCPGASSSLGPYCYYWAWGESGGGRLLVDPRTDARVALSDEELELVEELLRSRPFGTEEIRVRPGLADSGALDRLRRRLDI